jgi:ribonucleoside-diphosphate reductase alpha chain
MASFSAGSDASPQAILQREQREARAQAAAAMLHHGATPAPSSHNGNGVSHDSASSHDSAGNGRAPYEDRTPPHAGIAPEPTAARMQDRTATLTPDRTAAMMHEPAQTSVSLAADLAARSGIGNLSSRSAAEGSASSLQPEDRGIYAPAEAMRSMYDMGDAPSCATCGAIMTRSGSCYRCMSCGSTSGCS